MSSVLPLLQGNSLPLFEHPAMNSRTAVIGHLDPTIDVDNVAIFKVPMRHLCPF
jgi:hypothetical protein